MPIHPTAVIDARAEIDSSAEIGPYVVVDGPARIAARCRLFPHVVVAGWTTIGADNVIHSGAVIGDAPQDRSYDGSISYVQIGDRNILREHVQVHRGTAPESITVIGDDNFFMATAHVAHNCRVGNHVTIANGSMLGGHVVLGDQIFIGGNCAIHQHVRLGRLCFMRGGSRADKDVPPFAMIDELNIVRGVNRVGLSRAGFSAVQIRALETAFRRLFWRRCNLRLAIEEIESAGVTAEVRELLDFIAASERGVCVGPRAPG